MKIGIFGGSFNPPHKMHIKIAQELIKQHYVDKIIFVPTGSKYEYKNNLISDRHRYKMLEMITHKDNKMEVSDYELKDKVVYTCETLKYFKELNPNDEVYFICGADNFSYIDKWKNGLEILNNYKIIVIERKGHEINELLNKYASYISNIMVATISIETMSSTLIRNLIKENKMDELNRYLDQDVIDYIRMEKLYID